MSPGVRATSFCSRKGQSLVMSACPFGLNRKLFDFKVRAPKAQLTGYAMLSFSKILFTALIIVVVWQGFKLFNRSKEVSNNQQPKQTGHNKKKQSKPAAQEMEKCPNCGVYHAEGDAHRCDG